MPFESSSGKGADLEVRKGARVGLLGVGLLAFSARAGPLRAKSLPPAPELRTDAGTRLSLTGEDDEVARDLELLERLEEAKNLDLLDTL